MQPKKAGEWKKKGKNRMRQGVGEMGPIYVASLYAAGLIGAGFASGQELVIFFLKYGKWGLAGLALSVAVLTVGAQQVLEFCHAQEVRSYQGLFQVLGAKGALLFDWIYSAFLLVGVSVMLAGIGAMGSTVATGTVLRLFSALLVLGALRKGIKGSFELAVWLAPVMVVFLAGLAWNWWFPSASFTFLPGSWRGLEAALLYASYNLGFSMPLLASVHHCLKSKAQRWGAVLLGNIFLGLTMLVLILSLNNLTPAEQASPFPLAHIAGGLGSSMEKVYQLILWVSMFTTALTNCLSLVKRLSISRGSTWLKTTLLVLAPALALSFLGFANLIKGAYPLLGLSGLYLLIHLFRAGFSRL